MFVSLADKMSNKISIFPQPVIRVAAPLRQQVVDMLRDAVASGRFLPGERLVERDLCEMLAVSRPLLREALRQLEAEGLVRTIPQRGIEVATISLEDARQIYQVRGALEGLAAADFVDNATDAHWHLLTEAMTALEKAAAEGIPSQVHTVKNRFYDVLLDGCGNPVLSQVLRQLHNRIQLLRGTSLSEPGRLANMIKELRAIYDALVARDGARAKAVCTTHIENAARVTMQALERRLAQQGSRERRPQA